MAPAFRVHLVTLGVADLARASAFYEALGLERRLPGLENVAFFMAGPVVISLYPRERLAHDAQLPHAVEGDGFGGITLAFNVTSAEAVGEAMDLAATHGAKVLRPAAPIFWGGVVGYFEDPDGHVWEVAFNPDFPFADDDRLMVPEA